MYLSVSVIIPAYNAANSIRELIKSISNQTYSSEKTEIIVIDDCSTDKTLDILAELKHQYDVQIISHDQNKGLAAARNTGIKNSSGRIFIFIDADMIVGSHYIENHINFHNNKQVVGVVGNIVRHESLKYDKYQKYLYKTKRGVKKYSPKESLPFHAFIFGNTSIKKEVIDNCGLFDEEIKAYGGEDTEFSFRIAQKYPQGLFYSLAIKSIHNHYRDLDSALINVSRFGETNIPYIIKKHPEMSKLYALKYISIKYDNSSIFHRIIGKFIMTNLFYITMKFIYKTLPFPICTLPLKALMASVLLRGAKRGLNQ